jgi:hypothetical protein
MRLEGRATLSATQVRTGRHIVADRLHSLVQAWAFGEGSASVGEIEAAVAQDLRNAPLIGGNEVTCYRGRLFADGYFPTRADMGPPPENNTSRGRYNCGESRALYLCEVAEAVSREVSSGEERLWIQQYVLPTNDLKLLDLRLSSGTELLNHTMWFAENAGDHGAATHDFSNQVSALVRGMCDGFIASGVRGEEGFRYCNIVVLRRLHEWESWMAPGVGPEAARAK